MYRQVCIFMYVFVCMHVYVCICTRACMYTCVYAHVCMYVSLLVPLYLLDNKHFWIEIELNNGEIFSACNAYEWSQTQNGKYNADRDNDVAKRKTGFAVNGGFVYEKCDSHKTIATNIYFDILYHFICLTYTGNSWKLLCTWVLVRPCKHGQDKWTPAEIKHRGANIVSRTHYSDVIMGVMGSQIISLTSVYSTVYSGADKSNQSSASLAFVMGNSPVPGEFPAQMVSNAKIVSIWWRHHDYDHIISRLSVGCGLAVFA